MRRSEFGYLPGTYLRFRVPTRDRRPLAQNRRETSDSRPWCASTSSPNTHTMPSSDYAAASGGALRLKGGGVDKKKKKKKPKTADGSASEKPTSELEAKSKSPSHTPGRSVSPSAAEKAIKHSGGREKTEAEKRYDEMRRKRRDEKIKKEGFKTHKEKVEELNKYLSGLSEHHDMPKIGPG
ncbi:DUF1754-domain-containing protein [Corynespora cassiicola Philippines]|uniref:DUF1754-domain-containing protein n=1 Tax=Corynespora cassiicola Philippines TaxID=1448308 RepID=A0A2T2NM03_CORCC|nr:DUF1754-domain-containing protein [Corynespora cassiicola Philippines]